MIVPRSRLLHWTALIALPFSVLLAAVPASLPLSLGVMALLVLLVVLDAALAQGRLDGIGVEMPEVVRLSKDRPADLELRIRNQRNSPRRVRIGLAWPREIFSPKEDLETVLPDSSPLSRLSWPCVPLQRGRFFLNRAYLERASPLGFWAVRSVVPLRAELRVYPNLLTERKHVAALFLQRGNSGLRRHRQVGKGREFEKLREYVPGDSFDEIHWKATAKRGRPATKVFQIERTQEVYVVIDASRLSARPVPTRLGASRYAPAETHSAAEPPLASASQTPPNTETILERYITAALVLGLAAQRQGDLFGLVTFNDRIQKFVRASNGRGHFQNCRDALFTLHPTAVSPDFDELGAFLRLRLRRRALLVFLTALDDPILAESFVRSVELLGRQHLVLVFAVQPPGAQPLFTGADPSSVDELYQRLGGHLLWHDLRELGKVLQRRGARLSLLDNETLTAQLVSHYLDIKQRQLL